MCVVTPAAGGCFLQRAQIHRLPGEFSARTGWEARAHLCAVLALARTRPQTSSHTVCEHKRRGLRQSWRLPGIVAHWEGCVLGASGVGGWRRRASV